jgi:ABC-type polar amino acid transport system ATPase subunit
MAEPMIEIKDLHKHFGKLLVLRGVSVSVTAGEVVVIIGASGSGKTTLLRCINHLEVPDSGEVRVDGIRLTDRAADIRAVRVECGMVFQQFNLYPHLTVLDNVTLGPRVVRKVPRRTAEAMAHELLAKVGLSDKLPIIPVSYQVVSSSARQSRAPWPCSPR